MATEIRSDLLTRQQAADFLGIRPQTLSVWAVSKRYSLPYTKVGRAVRYKRSDLEKFIANRTVGAFDAE